MRAEAIRRSKDTVAIYTISGSDEDAPAQIHPFLSYQSLLPSEQVAMVVADAQELAIDKELASFAATQIPERHVLLLYTTSKEPTKPQTKRIATLETFAHHTVAVPPLTPTQQIVWIQEEAQRIGATIDKATAQALISRVGEESGKLHLTIRQLAAASNDTTLSLPLIHSLIPPSSAPDQWALANAIGKLDKRGIVLALHQQLAQGVGEYQLIGSLASGIRNLLMVSEHSAMNMPPAMISRTTGIHPFVLSKIIATARTVNPNKLRAFHGELARIDQRSKQGKLDVRDHLFAAVLSL
jgi:DNA polymerase III delta subunit